jgi:hypothetical protein
MDTRRLKFFIMPDFKLNHCYGISRLTPVMEKVMFFPSQAEISKINKR